MGERKIKLAFYWAASCGGCEISILDINEKILDITQFADIVFWPVALDTRYRDIEEMPGKYIDACFFNGSIRNSEQEYMAKLLREKSKLFIAYGTCAYLGGVPGLANLCDKDEVLKQVYIETFSSVNPNNTMPKPKVHVEEGELDLPEFYDTVRTLDQVVDVDYYVPGCPPAMERTIFALEMIEKGDLPPKGSILASLKSVCDECPKKKENKRISQVYRIYEKILDSERCLLEQGVICMGPATRGGCGAKCLKVNMPCTGCGGQCPNVNDQGAAMIGALASVIGVGEREEWKMHILEEVKRIIDQVVDPVGTFYMYALPSSILKRRFL